MHVRAHTLSCAHVLPPVTLVYCSNSPWFVALCRWSTEAVSVRTGDDDGTIGGAETCRPSCYGGPDANGKDARGKRSEGCSNCTEKERGEGQG
eukprot:1729381-Prymnesium_polylepis.1